MFEQSVKIVVSLSSQSKGTYFSKIVWALFRAVNYGIHLDLENLFGNFVRFLLLIEGRRKYK